MGWLDPLVATVVVALLFSVAFSMWLMWLYAITLKRLRAVEFDNYRLFRRLGQYHSISLGDNIVASPDPPPFHNASEHVAPFFTTKRPTPPPGWKPASYPQSKEDL